ncbi:MAG: PilZ domain-containing protein [Gammaproteobacteria bacterium]|nr:PilZ domain-containing protein [Gammaproteobacteria bacterium]
MSEVGISNMGSVGSVEQRWSQRRPLTVSVEVFEHGDLLTQGQSKDIGLGGVFVSFDDNVVNTAQEVELFFLLGEAENTTRHKLKAKIVRTAEDGAGFMFRDFDTNAFRALQEVMRHSHAAPA